MVQDGVMIFVFSHSAVLKLMIRILINMIYIIQIEYMNIIRLKVIELKQPIMKFVFIGFENIIIRVSITASI